MSNANRSKFGGRAPQSLAESAAMLRDRLRQDFGDDQQSVASGLEDEVDEWAALNKYAVLQSY